MFKSISIAESQIRLVIETKESKNIVSEFSLQMLEIIYQVGKNDWQEFHKIKALFSSF